MLTFGSLFDNIFSMSGQGEGSLARTSELSDYVANLEDSILELNKALQDQNISFQERLNLEQQLITLELERDNAIDLHSDALQNNLDSLSNIRDDWQSLSNTLDFGSHNALNQFQSDITSLIDRITAGERPMEDLIPQISALLGNLGGSMIKEFSNSFEGGFAGLFKFGLGSVKKLGKTLIGGLSKSLGPFGRAYKVSN